MTDPTDSHVKPAIRTGLRRFLYILAGLFFVGLAALGIFLPILPATPFAILASVCFVRSSPRLYAWLLRTRLFGPMLRDWHQHRGVRRWVKVTAICMLVLAVGVSASLLEESPPLIIGLCALALIGLIVVLRLPVISKKRDDENKPAEPEPATADSQ